MPNRKNFNLTHTKAHYRWRRPEPAPRSMQGFARVLEGHDIRVDRVGDGYLYCELRPGAIWTALSGLPSDPERAYYNGAVEDEEQIEPRPLPPDYRRP